MKFTDTDKVTRQDKTIILWNKGSIFAKLTESEAKAILTGCKAYELFLDREWADKIDQDLSPERIAYIKECKASR